MKERLEQLSINLLFRPVGMKEVFYTIQEAANYLGKVTVRPGYRHPANYDVQRLQKFKQSRQFCRGTLFKEIEAVSFDMNDKMVRLMDLEPGNRQLNDAEFGEKMVTALIRFFLRNWNPLLVHVVAHTGGYDSRLLSGILKTLGKELGKDLGTLYFVCIQPEVESFKTVMEIEGWESKQIIGLDSQDLNYCRESLLFPNVGRYCSDINTGRLGCYCQGFMMRKQLEKVAGNQGGQIITGYAGIRYVANRRRWRTDIARCLFGYWYDVHWEVPMWNPMDPFLSADCLTLALENEPSSDTGRIARFALRAVDPQLATVPRHSGKDLPMELSHGTRAMLQKDFEASWYFKSVLYGRSQTWKLGRFFPGGGMSRQFDTANVWTQYFKAAICEHLINEGCEVTAG